MSYPPGSQSYYPAQQPGGYDAYAPQFARTDMGARERLQYLRIAVAVLGGASYLFSFGPVLAGHGGTDWPVRFALFAGILAAFGLTSEPTRAMVAALAAVGFLDALALLVNTSSQVGWALWVILALNGIQALAAISAVVSQPAAAAAERAAASAYEAYAGYYAQASQYYDQHGQPSQPDVQRQNATARAASRQPATTQQTHQPSASTYGSYADYTGDYGSQRAAAPAQPTQQATASDPRAGLPSFGHNPGTVARHDAETGHAPRPTAQQ